VQSDFEQAAMTEERNATYGTLPLNFDHFENWFSNDSSVALLTQEFHPSLQVTRSSDERCSGAREESELG
jgi:hypothetical protein